MTANDPQLLAHAAFVRRLARGLLADPAAADDVAQEALLRLWRQPPRLPGSVRRWLQQVVRRLAAKWHRGQRRSDRRAAALASPGVAAAPLDGLVRAETLCAVADEVAALPPELRDVVLLRYHEALMPRHVAVRLGVDVATVENRLRRAHRALAQGLQRRFGADHWRAGVGALVGALPEATLPLGVAMAAKGKFVACALPLLLLVAVSAWLWLPDAAPVPAPAAVRPVVAASAPVEADRQGERRPVGGRLDSAQLQGSGAAAADSVAIRTVDADTGHAVETFGLRTAFAPGRARDLSGLSLPLEHAGRHADGLLVLPAAELAGRTLQLEDPQHRYLPSQWFTLAEARAADGARIVDVFWQRPVKVDLQVIGESTRQPIAGTRVELLRPWRSKGATLLTMARTADRLQPNLPRDVADPWCDEALLLSAGVTGDDGHVELLVPPGEPLALRLLGPGHRPDVRNGWQVAASMQALARVETVAVGAAVRFQLVPVDVLRTLGGADDPKAPGMGAGIRVWNRHARQWVPPLQFPEQSIVPVQPDGVCFVDGLAAGDCDVYFSYWLRLQGGSAAPANAAPPSTIGGARVQLALAPVLGLRDGELRGVDVDFGGCLPGRVQARLLWNGRPRSGRLLLFATGEAGAPLPRLLGHSELQLDGDGRAAGVLPPARYAVTWVAADGRQHPLPDIVVRSGDTAVAEFVLDTGPRTFRIVEADGTTPASGLLMLLQAGSSATPLQVATDADGMARFDELPRDAALSAVFRRPLAQGAPAGGEVYRSGPGLYGAAIALGAVAIGPPDPLVLQLPAK